MKTYDVIIIGGGPGGVAAGVYSGRKLLNALVITESFGGQSFNSNDIENWIGELHLTGQELADKLEAHIRNQETVDIKEYVRVSAIEQVADERFTLPLWKVTAGDEQFLAKSVIITSGGRRRKLEVTGEKELEGRGVAYCSTCDAPLFRNKIVAVVGGGNAAMEGVVDLVPYAEKIYMLIRSDAMRGDEETGERIAEAGDKVTVMYQSEVQEIIGENFVTSIKYLDKSSGETKELDVDGIFIEIGSIPNSEFVNDLVDVNERGQIVIDHRTGKTSQAGLYAAGAVADQAYDQNNISVGDAVKAALSAHQYVVHFK